MLNNKEGTWERDEIEQKLGLDWMKFFVSNTQQSIHPSIHPPSLAPTTQTPAFSHRQTLPFPSPSTTTSRINHQPVSPAYPSPPQPNPPYPLPLSSKTTLNSSIRIVNASRLFRSKRLPSSPRPSLTSKRETRSETTVLSSIFASSLPMQPYGPGES